MNCTDCGVKIDPNVDFYVYIARTKEIYCFKCYNKPEVYEKINQ